MNRRHFLTQSFPTSLAFSLGYWSCSGKRATPTINQKGFFTAKQKNGRWWLQKPDGQPFWSIGLNHIDPATLRYEDSGAIWTKQFDNSMQKWLASVAVDLQQWGFNTLGWNQEVVTINDQNHRHSRSFTYEEYQWLDMPYCHLLPFIESHQWEIETRLPDIRSAGFAEWCDYVARDQCARMKNDPKLIGYFFTDCPTWVHNNELTAWKAPLYDPDLLQTESGKKELSELARTYYRVITDAIRRYDPNHLIFGDRYEANRPIPEEVISAAIPYVDVFSFQCFGDAQWVKERLSRWAAFTGKPVLLADNAVWTEPYEKGWPPQNDRHIDPIGYENMMDVLRQIPNCVGYHLCGAYLRNKARRYGLRDIRNHIDPSTAALEKVNKEVLQWVKEAISE